MGGSGSGRSDFGRSSKGASIGGSGPLGGPPDTPCDLLAGETLIASPSSTVLATLVGGDVLTLSLSPGSKPPVLAHTSSGDLVGTVMPPFLAQLVDCMQAGNSYVADILGISGGAVKVQVRPEAP